VPEEGTKNPLPFAFNVVPELKVIDDPVISSEYSILLVVAA
jgi:hypothetical protein